VNSFAVLYLTKNNRIRDKLATRKLEVHVCNQIMLEQEIFVSKNFIWNMHIQTFTQD
jgi:hypothetical protein